MNTTPTPMPGENYPMIRITDLHKSFIMGSQELTVLKGIDLDIPRGQMVAIVGASGAGKSTMLHIMGMLDRPTKGTVYFDNQDLFQMSEAQQAEERFAGVRVQISSRFVCEHEIGLLKQRPGDGHPLLFAAGQFSRLMVEPLS